MADGIIKWANRVCRGHDHILPPNDYEESWADGLCFCALYYAYFPEKIPIKTLKVDTDADKIKNLALAFKVGEEAGIDPLLDPDDTLHVHEKKSILLYLSEAYTVLKDHPQKFTASYEWNKKYDADEKARKFAEWKAQKEAEARGEIYSPPKASRSATSSSVAAKAEEKEVTASPAPTASKNVAKKWDPKGISSEEKEPEKPAAVKTVTAEKPVSSGSEAGLTYEISGRGKDGGSEGRMLIFAVSFKQDGRLVMNPAKDDFTCHVECPGTAPKLNIMVSNGAYNVGLTPSVGGQFWFDFQYKGNWANEPFCLPIKNKFNKVPDHPYTGASRGGAGAAASSKPASTTASVGRTSTAAPKEPSADQSVCFERTAEMTDEDLGSFNITCKTNSGEIIKGDFKFDVKFNGPSNVEHKLINNGDGTLKCSFGPADPGDYRVEVSYKGKVIDKGSWDLRVVEAMTDMTTEELTILVQTTDKSGNPKNYGGEADKLKVISTGDRQIEIEDQEDGRYTIIYPVIPGPNSIDVQYEGESLSGFPISFDI